MHNSMKTPPERLFANGSTSPIVLCCLSVYEPCRSTNYRSRIMDNSLSRRIDKSNHTRLLRRLERAFLIIRIAVYVATAVLLGWIMYASLTYRP
jgi:hypothetical protein